MDQTDIKTPNPCILTPEEQIQLLAFLKKFNIKLGTVFLPTASPPAFGASGGLGPNLQIKATKLDTIQDIQTTSAPQFIQIGIGGPPIGAHQLSLGSNLTLDGDINGKLALNNPHPLRTYFDLQAGSWNSSGNNAVTAMLVMGPYGDISGNQTQFGVESGILGQDKGGSISLGGRYTSASSNSTFFSGILGAKENNTDNNYAGYFAIFTAPNSSATGTERFRITSLGYVGINTTVPTKRFSISEKLQIDDNGLPVKSNNISLIGQGFPLIVAAANATGQTGAIASLTSFTTSSAGGSFEIGGYIDVTAFTAGTISLLCDYTDPSGIARTLTIPLIALAGTISPTIGAATDASAVISGIQTSGANTIKIYTSVSLFTGTYNAYAWIKQIV